MYPCMPEFTRLTHRTNLKISGLNLEIIMGMREIIMGT